MALVLRNASIQKQVSLLKCMKTRTVVTTANKNNNQAPISAAVSKKRTLRQICRAMFRLPSLKLNQVTTLRDAHTAAAPLYERVSRSDGYPTDDRTQFLEDNWMKARSATNFAKPTSIENLPLFKSLSCPELINEKRTERTQFINESWLKSRSFSNIAKPIVIETAAENVSSKFPENQSGQDNIFIPSVFESIANAVCPCPCPCGPCCAPCGPCCGNMADCNCGRLLPPPCNTPPKCIQYMQGYYYYPYGTWFCGPYHVNTGAVPVCGPVCPGTACGIAPPNPSLLCKCCCGLLSCSICNPQNAGLGSAGSAPVPWPNSNVTSSYGAPGLPSSQSFVGLGPLRSSSASTPGSFPPCAQECWGQPQSMGQSVLPIPFGVPGSTSQTAMPGGAGFNITFPPVQISPPQASVNVATAPQWAAQHGPCECLGCVAKRSEGPKPVPQVDTPAVMQSIIEPFTRAFPASKPPKNVAESCKDRKRPGRILEDPKVKATYP